MKQRKEDLIKCKERLEIDLIGLYNDFREYERLESHAKQLGAKLDWSLEAIDKRASLKREYNSKTEELKETKEILKQVYNYGI